MKKEDEKREDRVPFGNSPFPVGNLGLKTPYLPSVPALITIVLGDRNTSDNGAVGRYTRFSLRNNFFHQKISFFRKRCCKKPLFLLRFAMFPDRSVERGVAAFESRVNRSFIDVYRRP